MKIKSIIKTCDSCPAQWDIITDTGHYIYVKYRWGILEISITPKPLKDPTAKEAFGEEFNSMIYLFRRKIGDTYDGSMTEDDLRYYLNFDDIQVSNQYKNETND